MRRWKHLKIVVCLLMAMQGVYDLSPLCDLFQAKSEAFEIVVAPSLTQTEHSKICHCRECTGGRSCCCLNAKNGSQQVSMKAACDTPHPLYSANSGYIRCLPPIETPREELFVSQPASFEIEDSTNPTRSPQPLEMPPRLA